MSLPVIGRTIDRGADQEQKTSANERERTRRTRAGDVSAEPNGGECYC